MMCAMSKKMCIPYFISILSLKDANCHLRLLENSADRLAQCRVATNLQFAKNKMQYLQRGVT